MFSTRVEAHFVIGRAVEMAVDPKPRPAGGDQRLQVRGKGGVQRIVPVLRPNRTPAWRVMSDHDGLAPGQVPELLPQPADGLQMESARIQRLEPGVFWMDPDVAEIVEADLGIDLCLKRVSKQREIGSQRRAQERDLADLDAIVLEDVNVCAIGHLLQFAGDVLEWCDGRTTN